MNHPLRLLQAFTLFSAGLFGLFVFAGNLMDYDSNYQFVKHVLSMDTTFPDNALMWRAITLPWVWTVGYIGIIVAEGVFAGLGLIGGITLFRRRHADAAEYNAARGWGYGAYALGFAIWFLGFVVVGSEWFAMWQSSTWNGKETAMGIMTLLIGLAVLLALNEPSPGRTAPEQHRVDVPAPAETTAVPVSVSPATTTVDAAGLPRANPIGQPAAADPDLSDAGVTGEATRSSLRRRG